MCVKSKVYTFAAYQKRMMKITILQTNPIWKSPEDNLTEVEQLLGSSPGSDLYVLPEMWTTGFAANPQGIAEEEPMSVIWMMNMARQLNAALCGSIAIHHDGLYFNRCYFCLPDGTSYTYDKHHLFAPAKEDQYYQAGQERVVANYRGIRFLLVTCYDLRFPEWCRYADDYDAIICTASWPEKRIKAWDTLIRARAIENQSLMIAANRVGDDPQNHYAGHSAIIDASGETLAEDTTHQVAAITALFDENQQKELRESFPVLKNIDK